MATITDFQNRNVRIGNGAGQGSPSNPWSKQTKLTEFHPKRASMIAPTMQYYHNFFDELGISDDYNFMGIFHSFDDAADDILHDILGNAKLTIDQLVMSTASIDTIFELIENGFSDDDEYDEDNDDYYENDDFIPPDDQADSIQEYPINIEYTATDKDNTQYILMLHHVLKHDPEKDQDSLDSDGSLMRAESNGEINLFSCESHQWIQCPELQNIISLCVSSTAAKNLLDVVQAFTELPLFLMDAEALWKCMSDNKPLIDLADKLDGLGCFKMFLPYDDNDQDYSKNNGKMVLVADDDYRHGTAVYYEDGFFYLCQMYVEDCEDEAVVFYDIRRGNVGGHLWNAASKTNSSRTVYNLLYKMWDHYNRGIEWFSAPLSAYSYVNTNIEKPEHLHPIYLRSDVKMTAGERDNLKTLRGLLKDGNKEQIEVIKDVPSGLIAEVQDE